MLLPDAVEFGSSILGDLGLDVFDVVLVKLRGLSVFEDHQVDVFLCGKSEASENLERGAGDATFVGAGVFEDDDLPLLEMQTSLLREEEIGTLNNVLEMGFAVSINERRHIGDVDRFRSV